MARFMHIEEYKTTARAPKHAIPDRAAGNPTADVKLRPLGHAQLDPWTLPSRPYRYPRISLAGIVGPT